ncbi:glycerate kinase type-2 family protein [Thiomicrolovo sp. ZZH C-3]
MLPELNAVFEAAVDAVMPQRMLTGRMQLREGILSVEGEQFDLERYDHLYLCGAGKAALPMAEACEAILGERIAGGVIVTPEAQRPLQYCTYVGSTHPIPSEKSVAAAERLMEQLARAGEGDLILFLLSGGTSALIEKPLPPVTLEAMAQTTRLLLENGCSIEETNSVRKHLSMIKGGRLAQMTRATVLVLVVSDVIGDDLETIGSAPLYCDRSTYADVTALLRGKGLLEALPETVREVLTKGERGEVPETPTAPLPTVKHLLIGSNRQALEAAAACGAEHGRDVRVVETPIEGDVTEAAEAFCRRFEALPPGTLLLQGGETTVTVSGNGKGGRNQHFALYCLKRLKTNSVYDIICAGTDGIDGNSDAAGARISDILYRHCSAEEIDDALARFDSNTFFAGKEALIKTGYTGTNVMDVVIAYKGEDNG